MVRPASIRIGDRLRQSSHAGTAAGATGGERGAKVCTPGTLFGVPVTIKGNVDPSAAACLATSACSPTAARPELTHPGPPMVLAPVSQRPMLCQHEAPQGAGRIRRMFDERCMPYAADLPGLPAVAVPTGPRDGVPLGMQIIGSRWRDDLCLGAPQASGMPSAL